MNVLKKLRIVLIAVLAVMFSLAIASCDKSDNSSDNGNSSSTSGITDDDESFTTANANISETGFNFDTARLSSITIDVTNAKTTFYLGDTFSSDGVVVNANFMQTIDGASVVETYQTTDFTADYSEVDMYNIGTYPVEITYRYKATVYTKTYNINVISSELAASGLEYVGGIGVSYNGSNECTIDLGSTFDSSVSKFSVVQHIFVGESETSSKTISSKNYGTDGTTSVTINTSAVNTNAVGDYIVSVTYTPDPVYIGTEAIDYSVKAFILVHVVDDVTAFKFVSGTTSFSATVGDFDYSDWTFQVTRENSGVATVTYNIEDFTINGVIAFITGAQTATIYYQDFYLPVKIELTITESTDFDITTGNIYQLATNEEDETYCTGTVWNDDLASASDANLDASGLFKINKPSAYANAAERLNSSNMSKDSYLAALYFGARPTIKGTDSYISVKMEKAGVLVVYAASTGTTQRDVCVYDAPNSGNEIGIEYAPETKAVTQFIFTIEAAGTYYIQSFEGGVYLHGIVIAVAK